MLNVYCPSQGSTSTVQAVIFSFLFLFSQRTTLFFSVLTFKLYPPSFFFFSFQGVITQGTSWQPTSITSSPTPSNADETSSSTKPLSLYIITMNARNGIYRNNRNTSGARHGNNGTHRNNRNARGMPQGNYTGDNSSNRARGQHGPTSYHHGRVSRTPHRHRTVHGTTANAQARLSHQSQLQRIQGQATGYVDWGARTLLVMNERDDTRTIT